MMIHSEAPQMEGVPTLLAGWVPKREIGVLQGLSMPASVNLNEWMYKDIIDENDTQAWANMTEEWTEKMYGEGNSPAL